jgi:hypothetical protein
MRNDSIDTLLLRHYGSAAPAPVDLEQQLSALVRAEAATVQARQQAVNNWNQRRVSRRRVLQLVTFSGAGLGALVAAGASTLQSTLAAPRGTRQPAYSL